MDLRAQIRTLSIWWALVASPVEPVRDNSRFSGIAAWPLWAAALKLSIRVL
ncbi:hypothetical protein D3C84_1141520 [compost metagenome]